MWVSFEMTPCITHIFVFARWRGCDLKSHPMGLANVSVMIFIVNTFP